MVSNAEFSGPAADTLGLPARRKSLILAVMSLSTFMIFLDGTVVNTALPAIARDYSATNSVLQWVVNMYSLILAGFLLVAGTTGDRYGRKRALTSGMVLFGAGAAGAALAENSTTLIAMRALQGLGAAFALPATLSIITNVFPRGERARAIAVWTAVGSVGIAVGPALGGWLVDAIDWSAVFWLHMPVVVVSLIGSIVVPESRDYRRRPLDLPGAVLATAGLLTIMYGIIQGGEQGWSSGIIVASFVVGAALLALFTVVEIVRPYPMLPLHYFRRMDFTGSFLVLMFLFLGMVGVFFFLTQYFQLVQDRSALVAGLAITPVAATMIAGAGIASKAGPKLGPKILIVLSGLIVMAGMGVFSRIEVDTAYWVPALGIALFGLGAGIAMPTVTDTIMASVPVNDAGLGSAMNDLSRELGIALGVAILGSIVTSLYRAGVTDSISTLVPEEISGQIGESFGAVDALTAGLPPGVAAGVATAADTAFVDALNVGFIGAAAFVGLAIVIAALMVPRGMRATQAELYDGADESAGERELVAAAAEPVAAPGE